MGGELYYSGRCSCIVSSIRGRAEVRDHKINGVDLSLHEWVDLNVHLFPLLQEEGGSMGSYRTSCRNNIIIL